jgi:ferritin-like metal-binding protein YciE
LAKGKTCNAIMGILDEGREIMEEYKGALDPASGPQRKLSTTRFSR